MRRRLGSSELQPMSMRTVRRPAAPSFAAISARLVSLWFHVQWNCAPAAGSAVSVRFCVAAPVAVTA